MLSSEEIWFAAERRGKIQSRFARPLHQTKTTTSQQILPLIQREARRCDLRQLAKQLRIRRSEVETRLAIHLLFQICRQFFRKRLVPVQRHQMKADRRSPRNRRSEK